MKQRFTIEGSPWHYTRDFIDSEYIKVGQGGVIETRTLREGLMIDLDSKGNIVGVEILSERGENV